MPDNISPLVAADEKLNHETVDSFSAVATSDLAWIEKVWSSWFSIQSTLSPRIVGGLAVDGLAHHMRTISLPRCLRSLEEIRRRTSSRNALTIGTSTAVSPEMPMC